MPGRSIFVATTFSPDGNNHLTTYAQRIVEQLSPPLPTESISITPVHNWHLTWQYYGSHTESDIEALIHHFEQTPFTHPRSLRIREIITLPTKHTARVLAWRVHVSATVRNARRHLGMPLASWQPHITIARVAESFQKDATLHSSMLDLHRSRYARLRIKAHQFGVYHSTQTAEGVRHYEPLWTRPIP